AVLVASKQRLAFLLKRLVNVHAVAVIADERLRHEGRGLAVARCDVQHAVFENLHRVALLHEAAGADPDLCLAARRDLVMVDLDLEAHLLERETHCRADVLERIDRRHREVAALQSGPVSLVAVLVILAEIPCALRGVDLVEAAVDVRAAADAIEDEELILGSEERAVGDAGRFEIRLVTLRERARAALVSLHRGRLDHVAPDIDGGLLEEGIDDRRARVRHQDHVGLLNALPAGDGGAVEHLAFAEEALVDQPGGDGHVLLLATRVGEAKVRELDLLFFYELENVTRCHIASGNCCSSVWRAIELWVFAEAVPIWCIQESSACKRGRAKSPYDSASAGLAAPISCSKLHRSGASFHRTQLGRPQAPRPRYTPRDFIRTARAAPGCVSSPDGAALLACRSSDRCSLPRFSSSGPSSIRPC